MEDLKAFGDPWFRDLHIPYPVFWGRPYFVPSGSPFLVAYASAALHAMSYGLTHDRLLISALVYASFAILRRLRYSWRYGFADELLRMRMLIVVDPQRALVRQRLMLEQAVAELTEPMHEGQGVNLFNGIQALSMLGKLPERKAQLAHTVRKRQRRRPPSHEDRRLLMRPGTPRPRLGRRAQPQALPGLVIRRRRGL